MPIRIENLIFLARNPKNLLRKVAGEIWSLAHPESPWFSPKSVVFLNQTLKKDMTIFEWGSGRSTVWFAKRANRVTSIEHEPKWFEAVQRTIAREDLKNVNLKLIELQGEVDQASADSKEPLPDYVAAINLADEQFDLVAIDGDYRNLCVRVALSKLKPGGLLLIDNSDWQKLEQWGVPHHWPIVHRSLGFEGETTIWRRP